jgi:hypothetical protein
VCGFSADVIVVPDAGKFRQKSTTGGFVRSAYIEELGYT